MIKTLQNLRFPERVTSISVLLACAFGIYVWVMYSSRSLFDTNSVLERLTSNGSALELGPFQVTLLQCSLTQCSSPVDDFETSLPNKDLLDEKTSKHYLDFNKVRLTRRLSDPELQFIQANKGAHIIFPRQSHVSTTFLSEQVGRGAVKLKGMDSAITFLIEQKDLGPEKTIEFEIERDDLEQWGPSGFPVMLVQDKETASVNEVQLLSSGKQLKAFESRQAQLGTAVLLLFCAVYWGRSKIVTSLAVFGFFRALIGTLSFVYDQRIVPWLVEDPTGLQVLSVSYGVLWCLSCTAMVNVAFQFRNHLIPTKAIFTSPNTKENNEKFEKYSSEIKSMPTEALEGLSVAAQVLIFLLINFVLTKEYNILTIDQHMDAIGACIIIVSTLLTFSSFRGNRANEDKSFKTLRKPTKGEKDKEQLSKSGRILRIERHVQAQNLVLTGLTVLVFSCLFLTNAHQLIVGGEKPSSDPLAALLYPGMVIISVLSMAFSEKRIRITEEELKIKQKIDYNIEAGIRHTRKFQGPKKAEFDGIRIRTAQLSATS